MFRVPVGSTPKRLGPEFNPWYWNPGRLGVEEAPNWFAKRLAEISDDLRATLNPITGRWQVWARSPRMQHPVCQGWRLLFVHNGPDGERLPLDERALARVYFIDMRNQSGKAYFDRVVSEYQRDQERKKEKHRQDTIDMAMPSWEHSQIKVSGCGPSNGSKFSTYHS